MSLTVTPRMDIAKLADFTVGTNTEAAFLLLELLAQGCEGKELALLDLDLLSRAIDNSCARMDALEIPA